MSCIRLRPALNGVVLVLAFELASFPYVGVFAAESASLPANLNLASVQKTVRAGDLPGAVAITQGNKTVTVQDGRLLTPAQAVAVQQVLSAGKQDIVLGNLGNAVGGTVLVPAGTNLSALRVPAGVSVIGDFSTGTKLGIAGNLINSGAIYALSNDASVSNAIFSARNIFNYSGGLISSILPDSIQANAPALNLSLVALSRIVNYGSISSSAGLNLIANQIVNGSPTANAAAITAITGINIASTNIVNRALIGTESGSINLAAQLNNNNVIASVAAQCGPQLSQLWSTKPHNLRLDNRGGTVEAVLGSINLNSSSTGLKSSNFNLLGGGFLSKTLNVDLPDAKFSLFADSVTGELNIFNAACANVATLDQSLTLGEMNITGDPTFWNPGTITLSKSQTFGADVTYLAGSTIDLAGFSVKSAGFNITMVAGAKLSSPDSSTFPNSISTGKVTVSGASTTGGNIVCTGNCLIDSSSAAKGGNIFLAAYKMLGAGGNITISGNGKLLSDASAGKAGDITLMAPGIITIAGQGISALGIAGSPKITVTAAQPAGSISADASGKVTGKLSPSALAPSSLISAGNITAPSGIVSLNAETISMMNSFINVSGNANSGNAAGAILMNATKSINLPGDYLFFAVGGSGAPATLAGGAGNAGGAGGKIIFQAPSITLGAALATTLSASGAPGGFGLGGLDGSASKIAGGKGGSGGKGGAGGLISITGASVNLPNVPRFEVNGGGGGAAGAGGKGFGSAGTGGAGGAGGASGVGGKGGTFILKSSSSDDVNLGNVFCNGGGGNLGGAGGAGAASTGGKGGAGGKAGLGGSGGLGGTVEISSNGKLLFGTNFFSQVIGANGGNGVSGLAGGKGGDGLTAGGTGGASGNSGSGGAGGKITVSGSQISYTNVLTNDTIIEANGGFGAISADGAAGGKGATGGAGGAGGSNGNGGKGGSISLTASSFLGGISPTLVTDSINLFATGGDSGAPANKAASGGAGGVGSTLCGAGGNGGKGGSGGSGGSIFLFAVQSSIDPGLNLLQQFRADGGSGANGGTGGGGGVPTVSGKGGVGAAGGAGGKSGAGGAISVNAAGLNFAGTFSANSGFGGNGGAGGAGGSSGFGSGGAGGAGGAGAASGAGGSISLTNSAFLDANGFIFASSNNAGSGGAGADGGMSMAGTPGAKGGAGGKGSDSGSGGKITVSGGNTGSINLASVLIAVSGQGGIGGAGGAGTDGNVGGAGGAGGNAGKAGGGGSINMSAASMTGNVLGFVSASGNSGGFGGAAGDAGVSSSPLAKGLNGAKGGNGGAAGAGGSISLSLSSNQAFNDNFPLVAQGGSGLSGGAGGVGNAGGSKAAGGSGGTGGNGGAGGKGGKITLQTANAVIHLNSTIDASGSVGGGGGMGAPGVGGGTTGGAGGLGGKGGVGGAGGSFAVTAGTSLSFASPTLNSNGGNGGNAGGGGLGAGGAKGGAGGAAGTNGAGGAGGAIALQAKTASFGPVIGLFTLNMDANGGQGGNAAGASGGNGATANFSGAGGRGSLAAAGGKGGKISISAAQNLSTGTAGTGGIISADGGLSNMAGNGGNAGFFAGTVGATAGMGGTGAAGGAAGSIALAAKGNISSIAHLAARGGAGSSGGTGGNGSASAGGNGSTGGAGGKAGNGGAGGSIILSSAGGPITVTGQVVVDGGVGGFGGTGGKGGASSLANGFAGDGGNGGAGAAGGKGGSVKVSTSGAGTIQVPLGSLLSAVAGFGGPGGTGGAGNDNANGTGGDGGKGGNSAKGSNGGNVMVSCQPGNATVTAFVAVNGVTAANAGSGGAAGMPGGSIGAGGSKGGNGANGTFKISDSSGDENGFPARKHKRTMYSARAFSSINELKPVSFVEYVQLPPELGCAYNSVLIDAPPEDITLKVNDVSVKARKGVVLLLVDGKEGVNLFCLHEKRKGDVEILAGSKRVHLRSSEHCLISETAARKPLFEGVAVRKLEQQQISEQCSMWLGQFSITSAISRFAVLQDLRNSGNGRTYRLVMKNAALLHTAFSAKGPFEVHGKL